MRPGIGAAEQAEAQIQERGNGMNHTDQINELATALAKAQGEITGALKDSANPFYKSKYADLASCWDACREPLSKNGLSVIQPAEADDQGVTVTTLLMHASGQWIRSVLRMIPKDSTPQSVGSAIAYGRRYGLTAMIGIAQVDDDGNIVSGKVTEIHSPKGDLGKNVPLDHSRKVALEMMAIMDRPAADGDHDEMKKALEALDYHDRALNPDEDLYVAVGEQLTAAKRNVWKALISKARKAEDADRQIANAGRKF